MFLIKVANKIKGTGKANPHHVILRDGLSQSLQIQYQVFIDYSF